ncbi:MAG: cytochrome c biogenesis protein CcsA [Alphaproteobacteria bacterium]|nr:cytochrome c biogenesis protein CcsA [Alphaproteobacteria bacterium]
MRFLALLLALLILCHPARAAIQDTGDFGALPVLHEGRIKPMARFADIMVDRWAQGEQPDTQPLMLMAALLFNPAQAMEIPILGVRDKTLRLQLNLPEDQRLFSFQELEDILFNNRHKISEIIIKPEETRSDQENALLGLAANADELAQILRSFSLLLPLDIEWPQGFRKPKGDFITYRSAITLQPELEKSLKSIIRRKGENPENYNAREWTIATAAFALREIQLGGENSKLLRIIPGAWDRAGQDWFSPWALLREGHGGPQQADYLENFANMTAAWRQQDETAWHLATAAARGMIGAHPDMRMLGWRFDLERLYGATNLYPITILFYTLGALLPLMVRRGWLVGGLIAGGLALHVIALGTRIAILARPPVGTLYESLLFVALICVAIGGILSWRTRRFLPACVGSLSAALLLLVAPSLVQDGESLDTLSAVLNTHFWLTVHVLVITAGYGLCILAALVAHAVLWRRQPGLETLMHRLSLTALLLTAIGTALGGIWADQSWGRFWGWDPKENGALLIVLWIIWLQHGRMGLKLSARSYSAGIAFLNVVVALAWFGVNLLGVGLHSYGFITGIATALAVFCVLQSAVIFYLWRRKEPGYAA